MEGPPRRLFNFILLSSDGLLSPELLWYSRAFVRQRRIQLTHGTQRSARLQTRCSLAPCREEKRNKTKKGHRGREKPLADSRRENPVRLRIATKTTAVGLSPSHILSSRKKKRSTRAEEEPTEQTKREEERGCFAATLRLFCLSNLI